MNRSSCESDTQATDVRCPKCGNIAQRKYFIDLNPKYSNCPGNSLKRTSCEHCDYFLLVCSVTERVQEAYY